MTKAQLAGFVNSIQKPSLKNSEVMNLLDKEDLSFIPIERNRPLERKSSSVAQAKPETVAQNKSQQVAQTVAQNTLVAQDVPKKVAHKQADLDVEVFKEDIYKIQGVEARKKFVLDVGFGIASERRGKKYYLYGIKKIDGKKYRLYIGNSTKL